MDNFDVPKAEHRNISNDIIIYDDSDMGTYFCIMFYGIEIDAKWDKVVVELPTKIDFSNFNVLILLEDIERAVDKLIAEKTEFKKEYPCTFNDVENRFVNDMAKKEDANVFHREIDPKSKRADNLKKAVAGILGIDEDKLVGIDVKSVGKAN